MKQRYNSQHLLKANHTSVTLLKSLEIRYICNNICDLLKVKIVVTGE